jgi:hypothetical protein
MPDPKKALAGMQDAFDALEPLEPGERVRAMSWLAETLEVKTKASPPAGLQKALANSDDEIADDPKRFMADKEPTTDVERIVSLAYFLTKVRGVNSFKTLDLTELNKEAAGYKFSNAATTAKNATNQNGYLASAGGGARQITALGEKVVEALPDRDAVATVLSKAPKRRKRAASRKTKSSK